MNTPIRCPELGTTELTLSLWFARPGDRVFEGDRLVEVLLGAATFDLSAPATGVLVERWAVPNERLKPGQILGVIAEEEA